jgi:hypothetical protein
VELAIRSEWVGLYGDNITAFLVDAEEWDKLECWLDVVWMFYSPKTPRKYLERAMRSLSQHRPNAIQRLQQWVERRCKVHEEPEPEPFRGVCERVKNGAPENQP